MGVSKPVCLGDLGVTLCSLSLKPLASVHLTSLLFHLISLFPSFNTHNIVNFAVVSAICLQFLCRSSVFFLILFWQSGSLVWTSIKADIRSFRMFFNSSSSSIHFLYIHNQGLGAGTHQSLGENMPWTARCPRTHTFTHTLKPCRPLFHVSRLWEEVP